MTEITTPLWLELDASTKNVEKQMGWPFIAVEPSPLPEIEKFVKSFISKPTEMLTAKINEINSTLFLQYITDTGKYRGIIIPSNFPSLEQLMRSIFKKMRNIPNTFEGWIKDFFKLRSSNSSLKYFQVNNEYNLKIPPLFVLNHQQISGILLMNLRKSVETLKDLTQRSLEQVYQSSLPEQYVNLIEHLPAEKELTFLHLINTFLHNFETIDFSEYIYLRDLIKTITNLQSELILLNFIFVRLGQGKSIDEKLLNYFEQNIETKDGISMILYLRVLIQLSKSRGDIFRQEKYNQILLQKSSMHSWSKLLDLISAQIGLASASVQRGDYFRAMTFYSFAKQGFSNLGYSSLQDEMEKEFQRISTLSATQQLQTGLYLINHHEHDKTTLLLLIDGIQGALTHFIRYHDKKIPMEEILPSLLLSAAEIIILHQNKFDRIFASTVPFDELLELSKLLTNFDNRSVLRTKMQEFIEALSFKDQKMIERISIFYEDGRHIGDYHLINGRFNMITQNPNQALFSSAMSAVTMLITEATEATEEVDEISIGSKKLVYDNGKKITFCLVCNSSSSNLKQLLRNVIKSIEEKYSEYLDDWNGNLSVFSDIVDYLTPLSFYAIEFNSEE